MKSAASTACAELLEEVTQLRDDLATYVTHAAPIGEPCPNCKGAGRV